jgi:hypothetical protein
MVQSFVQFSSIVFAFQDFDPNKFNNFLILGYVAMWAAVMVYLLILANRQKNAREDLRLLAQLLEEDEVRLREDEELR